MNVKQKCEKRSSISQIELQIRRVGGRRVAQSERESISGNRGRTGRDVKLEMSPRTGGSRPLPAHKTAIKREISKNRWEYLGGLEHLYNWIQSLGHLLIDDSVVMMVQSRDHWSRLCARGPAARIMRITAGSCFSPQVASLVALATENCLRGKIAAYARIGRATTGRGFGRRFSRHRRQNGCVRDLLTGPIPVSLTLISRMLPAAESFRCK